MHKRREEIERGGKGEWERSIRSKRKGERKTAILI